MRWRGAWSGMAVVGAAVLAACSLANAPDDPVEPAAGGGGNGGAGGMPECTDNSECAMLSGLCADGVCSDGTCVAQNKGDGTLCDDDQYCTENDACQAGACEGTPRTCETTGQCTIGQCNEDADACEQVPDPALQDAACDDGDPCTGDGSCNSGTCEVGADICAELDNECQMGVCGANGCETMPLNEGMPCDTTNICATSQCVAGACTVVTVQNDNAGCDDGLYCTKYTHCVAGVCTPDGTDSPCPPDQGCGMWTCDEAADACVVTAANEGMPCDDGRSCTNGTICQMGVCGGGPGPMGVVFSESFADNSQGWSLGPEWQIGPAMQTPCDQERNCFSMPTPSYPGGDPDLDHTPTEDNGVAGVNIGGIISQMPLHGFYYLESPPFNGGLPGVPLTLSFYRWLNSDYTPFIENRVEVFDGSTWIVVWASGPPPAIADAPWSTGGQPAQGWLYQEFDITPYKNPAMRVRFGFNVGDTGVYPAPGWNVDDVLVATTGCPDVP